MKMLTLILSLLVSASTFGARLNTEDYYRDAWCTIYGFAGSKNGVDNEVKQLNGTRVDCITITHAVEVDFASKWQEAIGQAVDGANQTGLKPGILLIVEDKKRDQRYIDRLKGNMNVCVMHNTEESLYCDKLKVWLISP